MTPQAIRTQSAEQVVSGYLEMIDRLPRSKRLDALAEVLAVTFDSAIRAPLLREFNNLMEKTNA